MNFKVNEEESLKNKEVSEASIEGLKEALEKEKAKHLKMLITIAGLGTVLVASSALMSIFFNGNEKIDAMDQIVSAPVAISSSMSNSGFVTDTSNTEENAVIINEIEYGIDPRVDGFTVFIDDGSRSIWFNDSFVVENALETSVFLAEDENNKHQVYVTDFVTENNTILDFITGDEIDLTKLSNIERHNLLGLLSEGILSDAEKEMRTVKHYTLRKSPMEYFPDRLCMSIDLQLQGVYDLADYLYIQRGENITVERNVQSDFDNNRVKTLK